MEPPYQYSAQTAIALALPLRQQADREYCYWDVRSDADFIIICVNLFLSVVIVSQVVIAYKRSLLYLQPGLHLRIYYFLFAWFVAYLVEYLFSAIAYHLVFRSQTDQSRREKDVVKYSRIFQFMDFFAAFLLLGCLYYVSFLLLHRIHDLCERRGHRPSKLQLNFYIFLKFYIRIRILQIIPTLTLLFLEDVDGLYICSKIELALFLFDSVLCNISLLVATTTIRRKNQLLNTQNQQEKRKLLKQSIFLQVAGMTRLAMGIVFIFASSLSECPDEDQVRTYLYLLAGHIIMHFVPVIVVLSIFRMSSEEIKRAVSQDFGGSTKTTLLNQQ